MSPTSDKTSEANTIGQGTRYPHTSGGNAKSAAAGWRVSKFLRGRLTPAAAGLALPPQQGLASLTPAAAGLALPPQQGLASLTPAAAGLELPPQQGFEFSSTVTQRLFCCPFRPNKTSERSVHQPDTRRRICRAIQASHLANVERSAQHNERTAKENEGTVGHVSYDPPTRKTSELSVTHSSEPPSETSEP
jgi:hypothetical protein